MNALSTRSARSGGLKTTLALLLVVGLFLLGILLTPPPAPVQALNQPVPVLAPARPPTVQEKGLVTALAALIPQVSIVNLPLIAR